MDGDPDDFETPLINAASYYETGMVPVLIEAGADLEATGREIPGGTALTHAVWFGQGRTVDLLVSAGAVVHSIVEAAGAGDLGGLRRNRLRAAVGVVSAVSARVRGVETVPAQCRDGRRLSAEGV